MLRYLPYLLILLSTVLAALNSCSGCTGEQDEQFSDTSANSNPPLFEGIVRLDGKTFGIPSALQISRYINETAPSYNRSLTNNPDNSTAYATTLRQALNLGVYASDFSYIVAYGQVSDASRHFESIKKLVSELNLANALTDNILDKIRQSQNKDSLTIVVAEAFKDLDVYLIDGKRSEISALVVTGAWVESLFLLCSTLDKTSSPKTLTLIADQKYVIDNIIDMLKPYYGQSEEVDNLFDDLVNLAYLYDGVTYNYTYQEPETNPELRHTHIRSLNEVVISSFHIKSIKTQIQQIRNRIVSTKSEL